MSELANDRLPPDDATAAAPLLPSQRYVNRELSWLAFNERVLEEASSSGHPLLERVRFLSISDSNLDEFYMVRVAGLKELAAGRVPVKSDDGLTPDQQLSAIAEVAGGLVQRQQRCWADLQKRLRAEGISILDHEALTGDDRSWLRQLFVDRLLPVLTPIAIDPAHPFPFIPNRALAMVVESRREDGTQINVLVLVPDRVERFIRLPGEKGRFCLVEEVLLAVGLALNSSDDGDRQMVKVLSAVLTDGLAAVEGACAEALADGVHSADVVLNILSRRRDPAPAVTILTPDALRLQHLPIADCARYDSLESFLMERTDILELMSTLKLYGMRAAYDEVMTTGIKRRHEPPRIVGDLLSAEIAEKQARSIKYQLTIAARIGAALASGLENALGVSQVVDVFRALTTAAFALANPPKIVMVRTLPRHSRARKGTPLHTAVHQT